MVVFILGMLPGDGSVDRLRADQKAVCCEWVRGCGTHKALWHPQGDGSI